MCECVESLCYRENERENKNIKTVNKSVYVCVRAAFSFWSARQRKREREREGFNKISKFQK